MKSLKEFVNEYDSIEEEESLSEYIGNKVLGNRIFEITFELDDDLRYILDNFTDEQIRDLNNWYNLLKEYFTYYCEDTNNLKLIDFKML